MTEKFDPRITPARPDIAAEKLKGSVTADRFMAPTEMQVVRDGLELRFKPLASARLESQLLLGEIFEVYEENEDWCWGQNKTDGYVGYVKKDGLSADIRMVTHRLALPTAHIYTAPDLKSDVDSLIGFGASVSVSELKDGFAEIGQDQWIFEKHLADIDAVEPDFVSVAAGLVGLPYRWGGRSGFGLDCSALVQLALAYAGQSCPRDSDLQAESLGALVGDGLELGLSEPGDLLFFPGHVGIILDDFCFLHANAFDMAVSIHRLSDVLDRAKAAGEKITAIRRI